MDRPVYIRAMPVTLFTYNLNFLYIRKMQILAFACSCIVLYAVLFISFAHPSLVPVIRRVLRYFYTLVLFTPPSIIEFYIQRTVVIIAFFFTAICAVSSGFFVKQTYASVGINQTVNFQGKVVNSNGTNVDDGEYDFIFTLYDAASGGVNLWTETQNNVSVTGGMFRVSLGSVSGLSSVNFNSDNLYLGINFNSDGEMTPRIRFASVPYAFNAQKVAGLTVTDTTGTLTIPNSKTVQFGGAFTTDGNDIGFLTSGPTSLSLPTTGTLVTLDGNENLSNKTFLTGLVVSGAATDLTTGTDEVLTIAPNGIGNVLINPTAGGQAALIVDKLGFGDVFSASNSGSSIFTIKNDGSVYGPVWNIQATGSAHMSAWEGGGLSSDCSANSQKIVWDSSSKQFDCRPDAVADNGTGSDTQLGTADLGNITLANSTTFLNTVSVTPTTTTTDVLVDAYVWTRSLSNTDQTITLEIRTDSTPNCTGSILTSSASSLTSQNGNNGPAVFASYVIQNPGTTTLNYDICAYSSTNNGAAAGGMAKAIAIDSGTTTGQFNWSFDQNGLLIPVNTSLDLALGGVSTESSKFAVIGMANSNTPSASISAQNILGQALVLGGTGTIETPRKNPLFIGSGDSGDVILGQPNTNIIFPGLDCSSFANSGKLSTSSNGVLTCLDDVSGGGGGSGSSNWNLSNLNGTLSPINNTLDLFIGGVATDNARFAFINVDSGIPTASISATNGNAISINANGQIQTTKGAPLTLGGGDSGDVQIGSILRIDETMGVSGGGLSDCSTPTTSKLLWDSSTNRFSCGTDQGGGGGSSMTVRESDSSPAVAAVAVVEFGPGSTSSDEFIITDEGSNIARVRIGNQVAMLNQDEEATGVWNFSSGLRIDGGLNTSTTDQDLTLSANGSGNILFNTDANTFLGVGTSDPQASFDVYSSSGTLSIISATGSTSHSALSVNNNGVGELLTASSSGITRFTIENDGTASISATTGSTYLRADGLLATTSKQTLQLGDQYTGNIRVGNGGSSTPNLFVVDSKNDDASDPEGVEGAIYYNTTIGSFRCYKSSGWQNCGADVNKQQYAKSSDQSVTNSTTLTDESALQITMGAGETWIFQYFLLVSNNNSATPDWKAAISASTASACEIVQSGAEPAGAAFPQTTTTDCTTPGTMVNSAINANANPFQVYLQGTVTDNGSGGTIKLQFAENTAGAGTSITVKKGSYVVAYKATGADLAEVYYSHEDLTPGDVVSLDPKAPGQVIKTVTPYDKNALGIVSTQPGLVMADGNIGAGKPVFLALSGRVPVKVSTESGKIEPGDYLTSSSTPGVAMKASLGGKIIGQALNGSLTDGVVFAFVGNSFIPNNYDQTIGVALKNEGLIFENRETVSVKIDDQVKGIADSVDSINKFIDDLKNSPIYNYSSGATNSALFEEGITSFGPATFGQVAVMEDLTFGDLSITRSGINNLGELSIQPYSQGNVSFLGNKIIFDTDGNISAKGDLQIGGNVKIKGETITRAFSFDNLPVEYESDTTAISSASAGFLTIREGKPLTLKDLLIGKNSLLYLTPRTEIDAPVYISSQSAGMAVIGVGKSVQKDIEINFMIVNLRN